VQGNIAIGVPLYTPVVRNTHPAKHYMIARLEGMHIDSLANSHRHDFSLLNSFRPRISSARGRSSAQVSFTFLEEPCTNKGLPARSMASPHPLAESGNHRRLHGAYQSIQRNNCGSELPTGRAIQFARYGQVPAAASGYH
jgi:hypothetical protein